MAGIKRYMGNIRIRLGDFDGAERDFREAKKMAERIFDKKGIAESLNGLGSLEWRRGNYRKAIVHLEEVRRMAEKLHDYRLVGKAYMGLSNVYDEMGEQEKGIYYSNLALESLEKGGDKKRYSHRIQQSGSGICQTRGCEGRGGGICQI